MKGEMFNEAVRLAYTSLDLTADEIISITVIEWWSGTRLRFNAMSPCEGGSLRASLRTPSGVVQMLEIEAIFWILEREWEVWDVQVTGALRRD